MVYTLPREGYNVWLDCFVMNGCSPHRQEAYALMRYFLDPEVSARSALSFCYGTPLVGAEEILRESEGYDPRLFPSDSQLEEGEIYVELGMTNREYERIFQALR